MHTGQLKRVYSSVPDGAATTDKKIGPFKEYRSVWISDVHLGSRGTQYEAFVNFLGRLSADDIYLLGDILDFMQSSRAPFSQACLDAYQKLLRHGRKGTFLWVVPGNHDSRLRRFVTKRPDLSETQIEAQLGFMQGAHSVGKRHALLNGGDDGPLTEVQRLMHELLLIGKISFHNSIIHPTLGDQRVHGSHGDEFDPIIRLAAHLHAVLGPETAGLISRVIDKQGTTLREAIFVISKFISRNISSNFSLADRITTINVGGDLTLPLFSHDFLTAMNDSIIDKRGESSSWLTEPTRISDVKGHDHIPAIIEIPPRKVGDKPTYYMNCGDWLTNCTALVEDRNGVFSLIQWDPIEGIKPFDMRRYEKRSPLPKGWRYVESVKL